MKVGILNLFFGLNYGAVLQAYALQTVLERMGHQCEMIHYYYDWLKERHNFRSRHPFLSSLKHAFMFPLTATGLWHDDFPKKQRLFQKFLKKLHVSSNEYLNLAQAADLETKYDRFICGSDQVWCFHLEFPDPFLFLEFVKDPIKKNAYAISANTPEVPEKWKNHLAKILREFHHVSVRETNLAKTYEEISQRNIPVLLDPTFLLTAEDWKKEETLLPYSNYILFYPLECPIEVCAYTYQLSKKTGLPVIQIGEREFCKEIQAKYVTCGPGEFLSLVRNATHIVTNSFHGMAFSIIFNKNFLVSYGQSPYRKAMNGRFDTIIEKFNLQNRIFNESSDIFTEINYAPINATIQNEQEKSFAYLQKIFEDFPRSR
ncbi:MAG: polysaccharide pyruvyl transferase family protein [Planctomycetia bacterium]|nr:polysaccharide pyruvyl transferase family protein [Planctomycetia bacterium]